MQKNNVYLEYEQASGIIASQSSSHSAPIAHEGYAVMEIIDECDINACRVDIDTQTVVDKHRFNVPSLQVSGSFYMDLPVNTRVRWLDTWHDVTDGALEIELDQPGHFPLIIKHPLYLTEYLTLENI